MKKIKRVFCALALLGTSIIGICSSNKSNNNVGENATIEIGTNSVEDSESMSGAHGNAKYIVENKSLLKEDTESTSTYDSTGERLGFYIDTEEFEVTWNKDIANDVACWSGSSGEYKIGETNVYLGKAIAREKFFDHYFITYLVAVQNEPCDFVYSYPFFWWTNYCKAYGYYRICELSGTLAEGSTLFSSSPFYGATGTSYDVGVDIGVGSDGGEVSIGGHVEYEDDALDIINYSSDNDRKIDIRINLNEPWSSLLLWNWKRYRYAQQKKKIQLFTFSVLTDNINVKQTMKVKTGYGTLDGNASFWASRNRQYGYCFFDLSI